MKEISDLLENRALNFKEYLNQITMKKRTKEEEAIRDRIALKIYIQIMANYPAEKLITPINRLKIWLGIDAPRHIHFNFNFDKFAQISYEKADEMLKERKK